MVTHTSTWRAFSNMNVRFYSLEPSIFAAGPSQLLQKSGFCRASSLSDLLGLNMKRQRSGRSHVWTLSGSVMCCWATLKPCGRSSTADTPSTPTLSRSCPTRSWSRISWVCPVCPDELLGCFPHGKCVAAAVRRYEHMTKCVCVLSL